jgi:cell wall-associated NlpC family hydrolase
MPKATRIRHLTLRVGILTALSATTFGAFSGVAAADGTPVPGDTTTTQTSSDDGVTTDPAEPTDPEPTSDRTVTFVTPHAVKNRHAAHVRSVRARHAREVRSVLRVAEHQRGKPYSYGGAGPRAFDCSGLVMYVYAKLGISLPHYTVAQWNATEPISQSQMQPGDLVFFDGLGHVGIYIGNGQFVDAPHTGSVVRIDSIAGFGSFDGARRVP